MNSRTLSNLLFRLMEASNRVTQAAYNKGYEDAKANRPRQRDYSAGLLEAK